MTVLLLRFWREDYRIGCSVGLLGVVFGISVADEDRVDGRARLLFVLTFDWPRFYRQRVWG